MLIVGLVLLLSTVLIGKLRETFDKPTLEHIEEESDDIITSNFGEWIIILYYNFIFKINSLYKYKNQGKRFFHFIS